MLKNRLTHLAAGFLYASLGLVPAYADDTEIYFGGAAIGASGEEVRPNVLFVLDTSGSMTFTLDPDADSGNGERLAALKQAMNATLDSISNVNVGIMRFTAPGGAVLYPVRNVDDLAGEPTATVSSRVAAAEDDAVEILSSGTVTLSDADLELVENYSASAQKASFSVIDPVNDLAEEVLESSGAATPGDMIKTAGTGTVSVDLELMYDTDARHSQKVGLRFAPVVGTGLPLGSTILSAELQMRQTNRLASSGSQDDLSVDIFGELNDSGSFTADPFNITNRATTGKSVVWNINTPGSANALLQSVDISPVVQEILAARTASDDAMTFILAENAGSAGGRREMAKTNGTETPQLNMTYTTAASGELQTVGLRFAEVDVPKGATITRAYIEFTAATSSDDTANYTVIGEASGNAAQFQAVSGDISGRTPTTSTAQWSADAWEAGNTYSTSDLTDVVQEIVGLTDWCGGNTMAFMVSGTVGGGRRVAAAFESSAATAPKLVIEYDVDSLPATGSCARVSSSFQLINDADDAEQADTNGSDVVPSLAGTQLNLDSSNEWAGLRYSGVSIPQGATIISAHLRLRATSNGSGSTTIAIAGEDVDNAPGFTTDKKDISDRGLTTAVNWTTSDWIDEQYYETADIKTVLQAIVNRAGWSAGNAMALILQHTGGTAKAAYTRDAAALSAAQLIVSYTTDGFSTDQVLVRDRLKEIVNNELVAQGSTPIVDTYYEAARYMRGEGVVYGKQRSSSRWDKASSRVSTSLSWTGGSLVRPAGCTDANLGSSDCAGEYISGDAVYTSPMEYSCQENHIVYLTDGQPHGGPEDESLITAMTGGSCADADLITDDYYRPFGKCGEEIAEFLGTKDQAPGLAGDQLINTHTIALVGGATPWLASIAEKGNGSSYSVTGSSVTEVADTLVTVFKSILGGVMDIDTSFAAPSVSVNQFNRLTHRNEIYYAVFKPLEEPNWPGNVKKYGLKGATVDIVDANNSLAVDEDTGYFKDTARSLWSSVTDGNSVRLGGANSKMPDPANRKLYVYHANSSVTTLTDTDNLLVDGNTLITKAMLGIDTATDAERTELIQWIRGDDVDDEDGDPTTTSRHIMADPLHSRPTIVTYDSDPNGDGNESDAEYYLFFGTNGGLLHAISAGAGAQSGVEKFAIVPEELMANFKDYKANQAGATRPYGLDGSPTVWIKDVDSDGKIEAADGDHVYLYIGMRRGGRNYYAYDLTNINSPKFMWKIEGGTGDFGELGQTWSKPLLTKIRYKASSGNDIITKNVLVFGAGYDANQDEVDVVTVSSMGRGVYMVDAETGDLLWSAGPGFSGNAANVADMKYPVPAQLTGVDINNDTILDMLYFGDTGGQVWRIDFDNNGAKSRAQFSTVTRIATLAGNDAANARRFYHGADVALTRVGSEKYLTILLGSGYRAHPLEKAVSDRFYSLKQPISADSAYSVTESDLYDATENLIQDGSDDEKAAATTELAQAKGWYITMENEGEKVLSRPAVFNGKVLFSTYEPKASVKKCVAVVGLNREYIVSVLDATAVVNRGDLDSDLTKADRSADVYLPGIVDDPVLIMTEEGSQLYLGTQKSDLDLPLDRAVRTFWYQE